MRHTLLVPYIFKLLDIVVGEHICFLQVLLWVEGLAHQTLPEGAQQVQRKWHICTDGYSQKLTKEMQQLFFCVADRAGCQDVLPLRKTNKPQFTLHHHWLTLLCQIMWTWTNMLCYKNKSITTGHRDNRKEQIRENIPCYDWLQHWGRGAAEREQNSVTPYTPAIGSVWRSRLETDSTMVELGLKKKPKTLWQVEYCKTDGKRCRRNCYLCHELPLQWSGC